jgi:DNA-binding MarR family transcriptional regulator
MDSQIEDTTTDEISSSLLVNNFFTISDLSIDEGSVINALTRSPYLMRSIAGIAKDTNLDKAKVDAIIALLMNKGLVAQGQTSSGQHRWYLTSLGRKLYKKD